MKLLPARIYQVEGYSMSPALRPGDRVLGRCWLVRPKVGDIVITSHADPDSLIKRVKKIEGNRYWLEGDNVGPSTDSRQFGWKDKSDIEAVVIKTFKKF